MARAEKYTTKVERTIVLIDEEPRVKLDLSLAEAETLLIVTGFISGDPRDTRRKHTDAINRALREVGIPVTIPPYVGIDRASRNNIHFKVTEAG